MLDAALDTTDITGAMRLLHTLKGLSATVGASYMEAVAKRAEAEVKALGVNPQPSPHTLEQLAQLRATFRAVATASTQVLAQVLQKIK